ncbi:serine carboxypeptidase [Gloeophyllum trabeum ATCC 11539]|uniref:Carboxypeptidase n=1 Tax=Gloeophyllum trabeum (strain ATCC 11539 / FP-39264 / Madison 617) TaxID=670483 RepID=S7QP54_GLOTA|nr:serine carboxypeptidase [Gloeophyllum trabeum ATCC 11539]EPQ61308.1 serine carboxypeptidase [Gloeophyllum trabeum ATCC 11539]
MHFLACAQSWAVWLALLSAGALAVGSHDQRPFVSNRGSGGGAHKARVGVGYVGGLNPLSHQDYAPFTLAPFDAESFKPYGHLPSLTNDFTILQHPAFPKYSVRIKKSDFCDGTVAAYTGYIDIEARHLFFYFFESRSDPAKDDVIFWTNGGPGGSSTIGLFMELGPCRVVNATATEFSEESWNSNANIFFIDQPVGVGFSYAEYGEYVSTTEEAAKDIAAFVAIFFENFISLRGRAFHMAGESYGGRYVPLFASAVYDQNAKLVEAGLTPINLSSIMIGNGWTDQYVQSLAYYDMQCGGASFPPVFDISTCVRMKQAVPRCAKLLHASCMDVFDGVGCYEATAICELELQTPYMASDRNPYDMSKKCEGGTILEGSLCYSVIDSIEEYLAQPSLRAQLGVDPAITTNHTTRSEAVGARFAASLDVLRTSHDYVAALLERRVRVLIYAGAYDWICNWVGNERWTRALAWSGQAEFAGQQLRDWEVGGAVAGKTRSAQGFTFATIEGAGHMAPYDKPKESLELVNRWLAGEEL